MDVESICRFRSAVFVLSPRDQDQHSSRCIMFQLDFFNPACFPIALMRMRFASWPERLVTVKCATDSRRRVFVFGSITISVIWIATLGDLRSIIVMSRSLRFAKIPPHAVLLSDNAGCCISEQKPKCQKHTFYMKLKYIALNKQKTLRQTAEN